MRVREHSAKLYNPDKQNKFYLLNRKIKTN